ncbi:ArsA family ATPase [Streptomyces bambusae]|uniref:ArsA family ATPase n=1 Tax=Streptomyces bambusae TaxID=1550616 RepID=UPI001CFCCFCC|nr:ArsA-related P-loop ATPase [Streptomyces bambusae]MCB5167180.1 ArsA family ATPase [Streptomyces bambusae]
MRTLLVTGPGGSGRTTVAAATALAAAGRGERVLLVGGALPELPVHPLLETVRLDPDARFRAEIVALQERGGAVFDLLGARPLQAEELTAVPGAEQFALLRALRRAADGGAYDLVVADLPPVREAVDLLALPAQLRRYLRRLIPAERQAARSLRPVLAQLAGVPMPAQWLYETADRWNAELAAVQAVIESDTTAVRLVAEPGPAGAAAVRAAVTALALHQLPLDLLVANRVVPGGSAYPWLAGLAAQQDSCLHDWTAAGLAPAALPHLGRDPRGAADLARLDAGPGSRTRRAAWEVEDLRAEDGVLVWRVPLPGATREGLDLVRRGDELLLTAGPHRRIVSLPAALRRCTVSGAALRDGELRIRFTPDPALWPTGQVGPTP